MSFNINEIITGDFEKEYLERANQIDSQLQHVIDVFEAMKDTSAEPVKGVTLAVRQDLRKRFYASCLHKVYSALMRAQNDLVDAFSTAYLAASSVSLLDETSGSVFDGLKEALETGEVFDKRPFVPSRSRPPCRTAMTVNEELAGAKRAEEAAKTHLTDVLKISGQRLPLEYVNDFAQGRTGRNALNLVLKDYTAYVDFLMEKTTKTRSRGTKTADGAFNFATEYKKLTDAHRTYAHYESQVRQLEERLAISAQASNAPSGPRQREDKVKGKSKDIL